MHKTRFLFIFIIIIIIFLSCTETNELQTEPYKFYVKVPEEDVDTEADINDKTTPKIGYVIPLTGGLSYLGKPVLNGGLLAIDEVNNPDFNSFDIDLKYTEADINSEEETDENIENIEKDNNQDVLINKTIGIYGKKIKPFIEDCKTSPEYAYRVAEKLIYIDNVNVIVGAYASGVTMRVVDAAKKSDIIMISPMSTSSSITSLDDNNLLYRTVPSDNLQAKVLAKVAKEEKDYEFVVVLHQSNAYGSGLAKSFAQNFNELGGESTLISYDENAVEFSLQIDKTEQEMKRFLDVNTAILIIGYPTDIELIVKQMQNKGIKALFFFSDGAMSSELISKLDSNYIDGSWGTTFGSYDSPYLNSFIEKYKNTFDEEYTSYATNMYDATAIAILSMAAAGRNFSKSLLKESIVNITNAPGEVVNAGELYKGIKLIELGKDINYIGLGADYELDNNGDIKGYTYAIWEVRDSNIITVKNIDAIETKTEADNDNRGMVGD